MANIVPSQIRSVDPYANVYSNVTNRLTQIISLGDDVLLTSDSLEISVDSTSPENTIVVDSGYAIKDDVLINIKSPFKVDMREPDFYKSDVSFDEEGYYYICLYYAYVKTKPPPEAQIAILRPSDRGDLGSSSALMFLGCVEVNASMEIEAVYRYDPSDPYVGRSESSSSSNYIVSSIENDYTVVSNEIIFVNDSTADITITFPKDISKVKRIEVIDGGRNFGSNIVYIDGNGNSVGESPSYTLDKTGRRYVFTFNDFTNNWHVSSTVEYPVSVDESTTQETSIINALIFG